MAATCGIMRTMNIISALLFAATCAAPAESPKFVAFAWEFNNASPKRLLEVVDRFDRTPLDGVGIKLSADVVIDGVRTNFYYRRFMHEPAWPKEAFADQVPLFRELTRHKSMRHCFVNSFAAPRKRIPWTDDAEWARLAKSMRTVAWVARQGGLKGLTVDPEDYHKVHQFIRRADDLPYDELCQVVRRRGRELFKPVFEEYPDATLHFFWFMSHVGYYIRRDGADPARMVRADESLWPSFLNGILDVLPPAAMINDGDEESYRNTAAGNSYRNGAYLFDNVYSRLVAPENIEKYRRQVRYSPAIYMDMYINKEGASWYKGPTEGSRVETLRRDLAQASGVCGGYVWFWGEKHPWVSRGKSWRKPDHRIGDSTWADALPGLFRAMEWVKDPIALYDGKAGALAAAPNLAPNATVEVGDENIAVTEKPFRDYESLGICGAFVTNVVEGVTGGGWYAVSYEVDGSSPRVNVFFEDEAGKHLPPTVNFIYPDRRRGVVRAPAGSVRATLVFGAKNAAGKKTTYSAISFRKMEDE